ncbi:uncharacterized protein LOC111032354 isoform X2 [Myzus persicae]|uniref:uncharacterized protein LOC111032354 isoform X2 n=1 Tax=Myzus persicae TaxID=13164 RepID=UPI000B93585C|nr:uncharacterized protein LOC111032354 isoform X2 [Myzus persicae]
MKIIIVLILSIFLYPPFTTQGIIRTLKKAQKTVFTSIGFLIYPEGAIPDWSPLLNPSDNDTFKSELFDPLVKFLNEFKINGLLINIHFIDEIEIDDLEHKINDFVTNIKAKVNNLIVGLIISGSAYESFPNTSIFDYAITNKAVDFYIIDISNLNVCDKDSVKCGLSPFASNITDMLTIHQVTSSLKNSSIDFSKTLAALQASVIIPDAVIFKDARTPFTSYSMGIYVKQTYAGIVLYSIDRDDYDGKCGCGKCPVINTMLDGWTGRPLKTCIIRSLVEANKSVYIRIGFIYEDDWSSLFDPSDNDTFQKQMFDPLVNFLNEFKVNGIIIDFISIYDVTMDNFEHKMCDFVSNIKTKVNKLIVGLVTSGSNYQYFTNDELFNFTITNKVFDLYIIDWSNLNICDKDSVKTGISPVTSNISDMVTNEQVTNDVTNSSMDISKVYAMIQMSPVIPDNLLFKDATHCITTYSIYCNSTDPTNSSQWCTNPSKLSYDQGAYAKKFYVGIVIQVLDSDDYEVCCECEKFPVSNQIIDGWTASPFKTCPKLDHK